MLGGNDAELDRLVAALEAEDEEHAAAAERRDSDVAMQLHEAELVDAGLVPSVATSQQMANVLAQLEAAEVSELKAQAAFRARKKKLEDQNAKRHELRQHRRVSMRDCSSCSLISPLFGMRHLLPVEHGHLGQP